jgi:TrmH family RNA methyltransferase
MGSFLRVNVHYLNLEEVLENRFDTVYACVMDGQPVYELQKFDKAILLIGNEGKGVSPNLLEKAGHKISIPARGKAESLNAAVATAVVVDNLVRILP